MHIYIHPSPSHQNNLLAWESWIMESLSIYAKFYISQVFDKL